MNLAHLNHLEYYAYGAPKKLDESLSSEISRDRDVQNLFSPSFIGEQGSQGQEKSF
jgi:hypothetical protein